MATVESQLRASEIKDVLLGELGGDRHGQPVHRAFAGRIAGTAVVAEIGEGTGVDDRPTAAGDHSGRGGTTGGEHRAKVDVDQIPELLRTDGKD